MFKRKVKKCEHEWYETGRSAERPDYRTVPTIFSHVYCPKCHSTDKVTQEQWLRIHKSQLIKATYERQKLDDQKAEHIKAIQELIDWSNYSDKEKAEFFKTLNHIVSASNGWKRIDEFFHTNPDIQPLFEEVERELIADQCFSTVTMFITTIERLLERLEDEEESHD